MFSDTAQILCRDGGFEAVQYKPLLQFLQPGNHSDGGIRDGPLVAWHRQEILLVLYCGCWLSPPTTRRLVSANQR